MKNKIINAMLIIVGICAFAFFIHGCKKTDTINETISTESVAEKVKKAIAEHPEMGQIILPVNEKVQGHWEDGKENIITSIKGSKENNRVRECADAATVTWPPGATLVSIGQDYNCTLGYKLTFTFNVSISVNLKQSFVCSGTTNTSKGRVRIKNNVSGAILYSELAIPITSITDLGDDFNTGNDNALFQVVYTTQWIPFSNFTGPSTLVTGSIYIATDCCLLPVFASAYTSGSPTPTNADPYLRVDPIVATTGTLPIAAGSIGNRAIFLGYGNIVSVGGCPTPPGGYPERQEIQVLYTGTRPVGSPVPVWTTINPKLGASNASPWGLVSPFTSTQPAIPIPAGDQRGTIGNFDAYYVPDRDCYQTVPPYTPILTYYHGNYQVRWRNRKVSVLPTFVFGPWSTPVTIVL